MSELIKQIIKMAKNESKMNEMTKDINIMVISQLKKTICLDNWFLIRQ